MIVETFAGVAGAAVSVWDAGKAAVFRRGAFRCDITDSLFAQGERVTCWRYAKHIKGERYVTFTIITRHPRSGYTISQADGFYIATPEVMKSFRKRLTAWMRRDSRPYLLIGSPVHEFTAQTLGEAEKACRERGKDVKKAAKRSGKGDAVGGVEDFPPAFIPTDYRRWKVLFRGARALSGDESHGYATIELTSLNTNRVMNPDPDEPVDIGGDPANETWRNWNVCLEAEEGIAWREGLFKQLKWHKVQIWHNRYVPEDTKNNNLRVAVGVHEADTTSPIWTNKKTRISQTLADALVLLGMPEQITDSVGIVVNGTKKPQNGSLKVAVRDPDAMRFNDGRREPYVFGFAWHGKHGKAEDICHMPTDTPIEIVADGDTTADHDGSLNVERILSILKLFRVFTDKPEYKFVVAKEVSTDDAGGELPSADV